jgi:hypothetical protein
MMISSKLLEGDYKIPKSPPGLWPFEQVKFASPDN